MLGTGAASSPLARPQQGCSPPPPAAPRPHPHSGCVASAAGTLDALLGAQKRGHALQRLHSRAHMPVLHADTRARPCTRRHAHPGTPTPLACTRAFASPPGHAPCTHAHTRASCTRTHVHLCTQTLEARASGTHTDASCACTAGTSPRTRTRCPGSQLTQTHTRAGAHRAGSACRSGGRPAVPLCRGEAPPARGAAALQPKLAAERWEQQLPAGPPGCARLSPGICTGAPAGCPNASHGSRVLHGAPAVPRAAGGPFPAPRGRGRQPGRAAGPSPAGLLGSASSPTTPLRLLRGLAAAAQGGRYPSSLFLKSRGPRARRCPAAPEATAMGAWERAGREGAAVRATALGQRHGGACLACAAMGGSSGRAPARACGYFGNNNSSRDTV